MLAAMAKQPLVYCSTHQAMLTLRSSWRASQRWMQTVQGAFLRMQEFVVQQSVCRHQELLKHFDEHMERPCMTRCHRLLLCSYRPRCVLPPGPSFCLTQNTDTTDCLPNELRSQVCMCCFCTHFRPGVRPGVCLSLRAGLQRSRSHW